MLFTAGMAGIAHTVIFHYDNPSLPLLGVYVGFVGSVPFLWIRDALRDRGPH
jgi:hypothetical protein